MNCKTENSFSLSEKNENKGFSLIEVVIAMAIVTLIIGGIVMFSVNALKASMKSQAIQESLDNARYAMDDLAKKVRTSSGVKVSNSGKSLFFIDNQTLVKYCYQFSAFSMQISKFTPEFHPTTHVMTNGDEYVLVTNCNSGLLIGLDSIVDGSGKIRIDGNFKVRETIVDTDTPQRGFVKINIDIIYNESGSAEDKATVHLQSGVSLADYAREDGTL